MGLRQLFRVAIFRPWLLVFMLGISLPSRCFSSQSLLEGESLMLNQSIDGMSEADMLAEIEKLEDGYKAQMT